MARKQDFIERENRTTIAGVIGIVAIVILVASYMEIQQVAFFAPEDNQVGLAAETFTGTRYVQLEPHEAYVAHLTTQKGSRTYYLYPTERVLVIDHGTSYEQVVLDEENGLYAGSYYEDVPVRLLANPAASQIIVDGLVSGLPPLTLTPLKVYDGSISVAGEEYYFRLVANELLITGSTSRDTIILAYSEGLLTGAWDDREVVIDSEDAVIIVHNLY